MAVGFLLQGSNDSRVAWYENTVGQSLKVSHIYSAFSWVFQNILVYTVYLCDCVCMKGVLVCCFDSVVFH
jgi:hypothetical protein